MNTRVHIEHILPNSMWLNRLVIHIFLQETHKLCNATRTQYTHMCTYLHWIRRVHINFNSQCYPYFYRKTVMPAHDFKFIIIKRERKKTEKDKAEMNGRTKQLPSKLDKTKQMEKGKRLWMGFSCKCACNCFRSFEFALL